MAEIALRLPIFIASPGDVAEERELAQRIVTRLGADAAQGRLLLEPILWENVGPTANRPQSALNEHLRRAELIVAIFWSRLGSPASATSAETGAQEEIRLAEALVQRGLADDLCIYFRSSPPPAGAGAAEHDEVRRLRAGFVVSKKILFRDYATPGEFSELLSLHLAGWLRRWSRVPAICETTMRHVPLGRHDPLATGENRLHTIKHHVDIDAHRAVVTKLGMAAVRAHQRWGIAVNRPLDQALAADPDIALLIGEDRGPASSLGGKVAANAPLLRVDGARIFFAHEEFYYLFCAVGLIEAIFAGSVNAVSRNVYPNPVHQYLAALYKHELKDGPRDAAFVGALVRWLRGEGAARAEPIARNFAAYVLGMIGAQGAQEALAEAAERDEGLDVRRYSICALGKLRSRKHLPLLVRIHDRVDDDRDLRLLAGQAICNITGVVSYPL